MTVKFYYDYFQESLKVCRYVCVSVTRMLQARVLEEYYKSDIEEVVGHELLCLSAFPLYHTIQCVVTVSSFTACRW